MNSGLYDTKNNFAVTIQPALQELPRTQVSDGHCSLQCRYILVLLSSSKRDQGVIIYAKNLI